jgi:hypothetical protein
MQCKQLAVFAGYPDCGSDAAPIVICVFRIFRHGAKHNVTAG